MIVVELSRQSSGGLRQYLLGLKGICYWQITYLIFDTNNNECDSLNNYFRKKKNGKIYIVLERI